MRIAAPKSENKLGTGKVAGKTIQAQEMAGTKDKRQGTACTCRKIGWQEEKQEKRREAKRWFLEAGSSHILKGLEGHDKEFHLILFTRAAVGGSQAKE